MKILVSGYQYFLFAYIYYSTFYRFVASLECFMVSHICISMYVFMSSVQSVRSDSLWPHELQHANLSCPSQTPEACINCCPLSQWCNTTILSSVVSFSSCPQSFLSSEYFPVSQFFASGCQRTRVSASASVLPMNT